VGQDNTQLLKAMSAGDASAAKRLTPLIYDELRVLARAIYGRVTRQDAS